MKQSNNFIGRMTRRRYKKGGNPDWVWGCYSGGKRHTKRRGNSRRTRRSRTYRRH